MPKVSEEHLEKKKLEILAAAKRVCLSKPIYNVTMRDIVIESGMSQGGVYKYFSNIDEVFVGLLNENIVTDEVQREVDALFTEGKDPIEILEDFFNYIGGYIQKSMAGSGKIFFELTALYANEPERFFQIKDQILEISVLEYLQHKLVTLIQIQVETGYFQPAVPLPDLFAFIMSTISGLTHQATLAYHAPQTQSMMPAPDIESVIHILFLAVCKIIRKEV